MSDSLFSFIFSYLSLHSTPLSLLKRFRPRGDGAVAEAPAEHVVGGFAGVGGVVFGDVGSRGSGVTNPPVAKNATAPQKEAAQPQNRIPIQLFLPDAVVAVILLFFWDRLKFVFLRIVRIVEDYAARVLRVDL